MSARITRLVHPVPADQIAAISAILAQSFERPEQQWSPAAVASTLVVHGSFALLTSGGCALVRVIFDEAELLSIAVTSQFRRTGLGRALVEQVLTQAQTDGARKIMLEVAARNAAALHLYRSAGFHETGRRPAYYRLKDGRRDDAVLMTAALSGESRMSRSNR